MSSTQEPKAKTISDEKFAVAARYVDKNLTPMLQKIIDLANEHLKPFGIRIAAEIKWGFDEVSPEGKNHEG
jgi:5-methylcytosine-specific restriction endonuclease McrBC GTP-binding regulatory subunit McrB